MFSRSPAHNPIVIIPVRPAADPGEGTPATGADRPAAPHPRLQAPSRRTFGKTIRSGLGFLGAISDRAGPGQEPGPARCLGREGDGNDDDRTKCRRHVRPAFRPAGPPGADPPGHRAGPWPPSPSTSSITTRSASMSPPPVTSHTTIPAMSTRAQARAARTALLDGRPHPNATARRTASCGGSVQSAGAIGGHRVPVVRDGPVVSRKPVSDRGADDVARSTEASATCSLRSRRRSCGPGGAGAEGGVDDLVGLGPGHPQLDAPSSPAARVYDVMWALLR